MEGREMVEVKVPEWVRDISGELPREHAENAEYRTLEEISTGIWHYDAVHAPDEYDPVERYRKQAEYHIGKVWGYDKKGRPLYGFGLMYHVRVSRKGEVFLANDFTLVTWQARGANHRGLGVCADLGPGQEPTKEQVEGMRRVSDWLSYERPDIPHLTRPNWFGHGELRNDGNATDCPGRLLPHVQSYRAGIVISPGRKSRLFAETGFMVSGKFLERWEELGHRALAVFGYPISREMLIRGEDGKLYRCQFFERCCMELHGEQVMLRRLGVEAYGQLRVIGAG
jgi:hypothetical protein